MIINEKIFVCFILYTIGIECVRNFGNFPPQFYIPQRGFQYGFEQRQQNMNRFGPMPRMQEMPARIQQMQPYIQQMPPWAYQRGTAVPRQQQTQPTTTYGNEMWRYPNFTPPTETTTPSTTTTTQRFLPHSPGRIRNRTITPPSATEASTTEQQSRKYGLGQVETTELIKNRSIAAGRDKALAHISANLQLYFLRAIVHDYMTKLSESIGRSNVSLPQNELAALENYCTKCSMPELQTILTTLLTIMEKYPPLTADTVLTDHVATEYERAKEYLNRKLVLLRKEMTNIQYDTDFREIQKHYTRRERSSGIMSLLLNWFKEYAQYGQVNEEDLKKNLMKYLTTQKRYWLISIRGVL